MWGSCSHHAASAGGCLPVLSHVPPLLLPQGKAWSTGGCCWCKHEGFTSRGSHWLLYWSSVSWGQRSCCSSGLPEAFAAFLSLLPLVVPFLSCVLWRGPKVLILDIVSLCHQLASYHAFWELKASNWAS